jgi:hypothetical protein
MPRRSARRSSSRAAGAATSPTSAPARGLPLGQSAFLQVGAGALHAARLHRAGRQAPHRLAREDAGPAVLRRLGAPDRGDAAGRVRRRRCRCACRPSHHLGREVRSLQRDDRPWRLRAHRPSCWRPAASRSRRWAPPASRTTPRAASASGSPRRGRRWCRSLRKCRRSAACRSTSSRAAARRAFREAMLFTHRGLSGPAILQISSYWQPGQEISIDLLPGHRRCRAVPEGAPSRAAQGGAEDASGRGDAAAAGRRPGRR